ncbi:hypothetical protein TEA_024935 [Camellia sinensis var. sinensis]|uniref:Uncharacterized protein n=1 Tax=Camellia sinensis var. sinensis TaxID=542762 RepID=A0A4S4EYZ3_CAMSN|nr:hypothetical protein TEA_024935 [Camellia sinensis var. sinensis]
MTRVLAAVATTALTTLRSSDRVAFMTGTCVEEIGRSFGIPSVGLITGELYADEELMFSAAKSRFSSSVRDRAEDYARKLEGWGKKVEYVEFEGKQHGFFTVDPNSPDSDQLMLIIKRFIIEN